MKATLRLSEGDELVIFGRNKRPLKVERVDGDKVVKVSA